MNYAGIDVGKTGAVGVVDAHGKFVSVIDMPFVGIDVDVQTLADFLRLHNVNWVALEEQRAMPGQGVVSMFNLGVQYGMLKAGLAGMGMPYQIVHATKWKPTMGIPPKSEKKASLMVALRLWPLNKVDLGTRADAGRADAMLIAEYGRRLTASVLTSAPPTKDS